MDEIKPQEEKRGEKSGIARPQVKTRGKESMSEAHNQLRVARSQTYKTEERKSLTLIVEEDLCFTERER